MEPQEVVSGLAPYLSEARQKRIEEVLQARLATVTVVLENIHNPHNAAAVLRTCEALGIGEVHVVENQEPWGISNKITQGAECWISLLRSRSAEDSALSLRNRGFLLLGAVPDASSTLAGLPMDRPLALVFGNEHRGLSTDMCAKLDGTFAIPMAGFTQSFNLSVAVAIAAFDVCRRSRATLGEKSTLDETTKMRLRADWYRQSVRGADAILRRLTASAPVR